MTEHERQTPPSTAELLARHGGRLDRLMQSGTDSFYDKVSLDDKDIAISMEHFYGGQGSPQYGIISRSIDSDGIRREMLFSWFNGNNQTNFLPAGYFVTATAPDTDIQLIHFDDSTYKASETSTGPIDEKNVAQIGELIDEYFKKRQEIAELAEEKKSNEKAHRSRVGLVRFLAETVLSMRRYEQLHERAISIITSGESRAAELIDMDDESIAKLIEASNKDRGHGEYIEKDDQEWIIAEIRKLLAEAAETPNSTT